MFVLVFGIQEFKIIFLVEWDSRQIGINCEETKVG